MSSVRQRRGGGRTSTDGVHIDKREKREFIHLDHDRFVDKQFEEVPKEAPKAAIALGVFLLFLGLCCLVILIGDQLRTVEEDSATSSSSSKKRAEASRTEDRFWPLVIIAFITLIPGGYVCWNALLTFIGVQGYSYDTIPR